jgi:hypothetical protein
VSDGNGARPVMAGSAKTLDGRDAFVSMHAAFERALLRHPEMVRTFYCLMAGRLARVRVVGPEVTAEIERPFCHLILDQDPGLPPALHVDIWEEAATGVGCEACEARMGENIPHQITASQDARFVVYDVKQTRIAVDRSCQHMVEWIGSREELTQYERGRPLFPALLLWLMDQGIQPLHAGLVAREGRGVLLGGPSGVGKSTSALACAAAGFDYLADDCVGLESMEDGTFVGHSLYASANLESNHLQRLRALSPHGRRGRLDWEEKSLLLLADLAAGQLHPNVSISAVALPRLAPGGATTARRASKVEALLRLAPSSTFMFPHARGGRSAFERLTPLIERVPTFWLDLGGNLDEIAPAVDEVLARSRDT